MSAVQSSGLETILSGSAPAAARSARVNVDAKIAEVNKVAIQVIREMRGLGFRVLASDSEAGEQDLHDQVVRGIIRAEPTAAGMSSDEICFVQDCVQSFFSPSSIHADRLVATIVQMGIHPRNKSLVDLVIDHYLIQNGLSDTYPISGMSTDSIKDQVYARIAAQ